MKSGLNFRIAPFVALLVGLSCSLASPFAYALKLRQGCLLDRQVGYGPIQLQQALEQVPGLKTLVMEVMEDPAIGLDLKRIITRALDGEKVDIVQLTEEIRTEWRIPEYLEACTSCPLPPQLRTWSRPQAPATLNQAATLRARPAFRSTLGILVGDRPLTRELNDLTSLIHELAHIRFFKFLSKNSNLRKLAAGLPKGMMKETSPGFFTINHELMDFLDERYAHEMEFKFLKQTYDRYFAEWPAGYAKKWKDATDRQVQNEISKFVIKSYGITDPRVKALKNLPLSKIMLDTSSPDRLPAKKVGYFKDLSPSTFNLLDPSEYRLAYKTVDLVLRNQKGAGRATDLDEFDRAIRAVSGAVNKGPVITEIFSRLFTEFQSDPSTTEQILVLVNRPSVQEAMAREQKLNSKIQGHGPLSAGFSAMTETPGQREPAKKAGE